MVDFIDQFKANQRASWVHFAPLQAGTTVPAAHLVRFAGIKPGMRVLDVACGTGVVAVTAARAGARVAGLDLTPELLEVARVNSAIAGVGIDWHEGDAEALPFPDGEFDAVLSQFGHIFAPRPEVTIAEMLRVVKPGGTVAFSSWPPELLVGRLFALTASYLPPPPVPIPGPGLWGDVHVIRERLGKAVGDLTFDWGTAQFVALSPEHHRDSVERTAGPVIRVLELLADDPAGLQTFRDEHDALIESYFDGNIVSQGYLLTRAIKV